MTPKSGFTAESQTEAPTTIKETVIWLHTVLNRPALPECPTECERDCNIKGGKAPAFIRPDGKAQQIKWEPYQDKLPDRNDLNRWFAHTLGVGTIGGWNGEHYIAYVDLDLKSFGAVEVLESVVADWVERYPILKKAPQFRTPSGGYRFILAFTEFQDWVAFSLFEGGDRMGELLSKNGSHTLLPPTVGTNGQAYRWVHFVDYPPVVTRPEDVGIYPTRQNHGSSNAQPIARTGYTPGAIRLEELGSPFTQELLNGNCAEDRSLAMAKALYEWYGWENFCQRYNIAYSGTATDLAAYAWSKISNGDRDATKWERIIKTVDPTTSQTASEHTSGDESGCWKRIWKLDRSVFEQKCPDALKATILESFKSPNKAASDRTAIEYEEDVPPAVKAATKAERLKLEIHAYLKEPDFATRLIMRGEICSAYRLAKQDFSELVMQIESDTDLKRQTKFDGADFFNIESDAIDWLIPRFLPKGEPIQIFADPGVGKTNLATDAVYAVLGGDRFLGEKVENPGKVLYICSDESRASAVRRMMARGVDLLNLANLKVWTYLDINNLHELEQTLEDWRPQMVVADSLTSICMNVGIAEKDPEFARYLYKLKNVVGRYNSSLVVIHHSNKNPLAKGLHQSSGTNRINAAFWGIYALNEPHKDDPESPVRELVMVKGREVEKFKLTMNFQNRWEWAEKGIFVVTDDKHRSPELRKRYEEVYNFLKARSPKALEFIEIDAHFNMGKNLYKVLDSLEQDHLISKRRSTDDARRMVYFLPDFSTECVTVEPENSGGTPPPCKKPKWRTSPESVDNTGKILLQNSSPENAKNNSTPRPPINQSVTDGWNDDMVFATITLAQQVIDTQNAELMQNLRDRLAEIPQWGDRIFWSRLTTKESTLVKGLLTVENNSSPLGEEKNGEEFSSYTARVSGDVLQKNECVGGGVPPQPREEIECGFKIGDRVDFDGQSRQVEAIRKQGDRVRLHLGLNQWIYADETKKTQVEYDEASIEDAAQTLREAVVMNDPAFMQDLLKWDMYANLKPATKFQIWDRLTQAERDKINELKAIDLEAADDF